MTDAPARPAPEDSPSASGAVVPAALAAAAAFVSLLVGTRSLVFGSYAGRWVFPYHGAPGPGALLAIGAFAAAAAALVAWALRRVEARPRLAVGGLLVAGALLRLAAWAVLYPHPLGAIVTSDGATSYWSAAALHGPLDLVRGWDTIAPTLPLHAQGNMPGKVLLFQALRAVAPSPEVAGALVFLLSDLVGVVVFLLADALLRDRRAAAVALALWLFLPGRLSFGPSLNGVAPLPVALALLAWVRFLRGRGWAAPAAVGGLLYVALVFDPTPLALGLLFVAVAVAEVAAGRASPARVLRGAAATAASVLAAHALVRATLGFDVVHRMAVVTHLAAEFNRTWPRPYAAWLWANLVEFTVALGATVAMACAVGAVTLAPPGGWARRWNALLEPAPLAALTGVLTALVLDLMGANRGEVGRLWIFLTVPFVLAAAGVLARAGRAAALTAAAGLALQAGVTLASVATIVP